MVDGVQRSPIVEQLLRARINQPIFSAGQGAARVGQQLIAALSRRRRREEGEEEQDVFTQAISRALQAGQAGIPETRAFDPSFGDLGLGGQAGAPAGQQAIIQSLLQSGSPQAAQLGGQFGLQQAFAGAGEQFVPVFDADGNIIGQRNTRTGRVVEDPRAERDGPSARDLRINDLMETFNLDRQTAVAVAENKIEVIPGTAPGEFTLASSIPGFTVGQVLGTDEEIPAAAGPIEVPTEERQEIAQRTTDITGGIDVIEEATGPFDFLAAVAERIPVLSEIFEGGDERQAGLVFETLAKDFQRAFANNPRFAQTELQQITEKIVPATGPLSTASALQSDLIAVRRSMQVRVEDAARTAADPSLQSNLREADRSIVINGRNLIRSIDQILAAHEQGTATVITTQEEFDALPSGALYRQSNGQLFRKQ